MNFSNEWSKIHSWYKVLIMIWVFSIICTIGSFLEDAYSTYTHNRAYVAKLSNQQHSSEKHYQTTNDVNDNNYDFSGSTDYFTVAYKRSYDELLFMYSLLISSLCVGGILFHLIIYKGVYLTMYNKRQYNRCLKEINDLTLLLQQKIVTEEEYAERTSILKDELLKFHA